MVTLPVRMSGKQPQNDFLSDLRSETLMVGEVENIGEFLDDNCVWKGSLALMDDAEGEFNWVRIPGFELVALDEKARSLELPRNDSGLSVAARRRISLIKVFKFASASFFAVSLVLFSSRGRTSVFPLL